MGREVRGPQGSRDPVSVCGALTVAFTAPTKT